MKVKTMISEERLFQSQSFSSFVEQKKNDIEKDIKNFSNDELLLPNRDEMIEYLVDKYSLEEIFIDVENIEKSHYKSTKQQSNHFDFIIDVEFLTISYKIPFEGERELLFIRPSTYINDDFACSINYNYLTISSDAPIYKLKNNPNIINVEITSKLDRFSKQISNLNNNIREFNSSLNNFITQILSRRQESANIIQKVLEVMNIPLEKNQNAPSIIPLKRKLIKPCMPTATREKTYGISNDDYRHILGVIRHVGATFERTRKTFSKLEEEELRDVILANLNGHYLGQATGETFRNKGKTDINIEFENRAAFVGECKIWKGEKIFEETKEQLLGYTTWRDAKNAIIFFNKKNKEFKTIQNKINELVYSLTEHNNFDTNPGEWEFQLNIDGNEKTIHIFLFDIYKEM